MADEFAAKSDEEQNRRLALAFHSKALFSLGVLSDEEVSILLKNEEKFMLRDEDAYFHDPLAVSTAELLISKFHPGVAGEYAQELRKSLFYVLFLPERDHFHGVLDDKRWRYIGKLLRCALDIPPPTADNGVSVR